MLQVRAVLSCTAGLPICTCSCIAIGYASEISTMSPKQRQLLGKRQTMGRSTRRFRKQHLAGQGALKINENFVYTTCCANLQAKAFFNNA